MASSASVSKPHFAGKSVTSFYSGGGRLSFGIRHSGGMELARMSFAFAEIAFQSSPIVELSDWAGYKVDACTLKI